MIHRRAGIAVESWIFGILVALLIWTFTAYLQERGLRQAAESREYWFVTRGEAKLAVDRMEVEAQLPSERRLYNAAIDQLDACWARLREEGLE